MFPIALLKAVALVLPALERFYTDVPLSIFENFNKIRQLLPDFCESTIADAARGSSMLEVNRDSTHLRRAVSRPVRGATEAETDARTIYVDNFGADVDHAGLAELLRPHGISTYIRSVDVTCIDPIITCGCRLTLLALFERIVPL